MHSGGHGSTSQEDLDKLRSGHDGFSELSIDAPLSNPLRFKQALHIGDDAFTSLKIKKRALKLAGPLGGAGAGAAVAASPIVATTFFSGGGILAWLGLATATTPIGWVIASAALSGTAWVTIARKLESDSAKRVVKIPKFINTPLDWLAISIFDLICPLAVKLAAVDGEIHQRDRAKIIQYFVGTWGYDYRFVRVVVDMVSECDDTFDDLVGKLVGFTQSNPDCNAKAISEDVLAFLRDVAEASNGINESERNALREAEKAFNRHTDKTSATATYVKDKVKQWCTLRK